VLRAYGVDFAEVKKITSAIPEEARISEELQAMKESGIEPSIIRYALESDPESFKEWVEVNSDGSYGGTFGPYFEMAVRLEGTKRNISTHAAAVVLASTPLSEMCPLMYEDGVDGYVAAMEYPDLEAMGQVKLDILGVAALDKVAGVRNLLRYGRIEV
jgi:DNA polymerase III alpha subunit